LSNSSIPIGRAGRLIFPRRLAKTRIVLRFTPVTMLPASAQAVDFKVGRYFGDRQGTILNPRSTNFDNNEGHVVGEGTVPPRSHAVEDRLLHIREW
jgi:hypothetical protein